jgi:cell division septal protein FtsQ
VSTAVLDDRDQRRAQARAEALSVLDAPRRVRHFEAHAGVALRPSPRPRAHARPRRQPPPRRHRPLLRRVIAVLIVLTQVALLVLALTLPVFQVKGAQVSGLHLLRTGDVLAAAGVPHESVFVLDTQAVQRRLTALPWVASATVHTGLPASVSIDITERPVALRVRRGAQDTFVAANGATMAVSAAAAPPAAGATALLDDRAGSAQPLDATLIADLATIAQRFPAVFGCQVAAYQWGVDDVLSLWTSTGWKAVLGHLDTQDALAGLPAQMAALAALRGTLDLVHPSFGYIDLENTSAPAVGGSPGLPAAVQAAARAAAAPAGGAGPAGVPVPGGLATPTPKPTPTPRPTVSPSPVPAGAGAAPTPLVLKPLPTAGAPH